jgi:uncharacterized protein
MLSMNLLSRLVAAALALLTGIVPAGAQQKSASKKTSAPPTSPTAAVAAANKDPNGIWEGTLDAPGTPLTLTFQIQGTAAKRTATLSVPEQGAKNVPVRKTTIMGDTVNFEMPEIGASFTGKLSADRTKLTGTFSQGGGKLPLTLLRKKAATTLRRPQTPKPPFPYQMVNVTYPNPNAKGVTIAGTLTIPAGEGTFPVVLLISGSGPQDRDEAILGHRPFAVIADDLARRGIASLRYDDRGVAKSTGNFAAATSADFASDVRAGVAYLKTRKEVNVQKIGLIGHSEGGLIAPMVAAYTPEIAFIVLLAGPGVDGEAILYAQQELIALAEGAKPAEVKESRRISGRLFSTIRREKDPKILKTKLDKIIAEEVAKQPKAKQAAVKEQLIGATAQLATPWFQYFLDYDPAPTLKKVRCPVLALNGEKDLQVPPKQNLPTIEAAVKAGGNSDVTVKELPSLNHLFQNSKTGSPSEYVNIEETFSPDALKIIGDWIAEKTKG